MIAELAFKLMMTGGILCFFCLVAGAATTDYPRFNRASRIALAVSAFASLAGALTFVWSL